MFKRNDKRDRGRDARRARELTIGRHTADAFLSLSVGPTGYGITPVFWTGNQMAWSFAESTSEVQSSAGSTGVGDLGAVMTETPAPVWSASLHLRIDPGDGNWSCTFGSGAQSVHASGRRIVVFDFPVAYTSMKPRLQEAVRNDFRQAVRTGCSRRTRVPTAAEKVGSLQ